MAGVIVLLLIHTPLVTYLTTQLGMPSAIKGWKETVLYALAIVVAGVLYCRPDVRRDYLRNKSIIASGLFLATLIPASFISWGGWSSYVIGVVLLSRYVVMYMIVVALCMLYPRARTLLLRALLVLAGGVLVIAVLQQFILDRNSLVPLGYGPSTILPYQLVDQDEVLLRVNSTLRGPNPLGAFAASVAVIALAYILRRSHRTRRWLFRGIVALFTVAVIVVIYSYSRAALLGLVIGGGLLLWIRTPVSARRILAVSAVVLVGVGASIVWSMGMFERIVLHDNPAVEDAVSSNTDHADSLLLGFERLVSQPLGAGIGSTGSASDVSMVHAPLYIENQYLHIAHEVGWIGLAAYGFLLTTIMYMLWQRRADWLALGVLFSGVSLLLIGIFLPVFQDDVVSLIWWCVAAIGVTYNTTKEKICDQVKNSKK